MLTRRSLVVFRVGAFVSTLACAIALEGCELLSHDGPEGGAVLTGAQATSAAPPDGVPYTLVNLNPYVVKAANMSPRDTRHFSGWASAGGRDVSIGVGDIVSVSVFEKDAGGLFLSKDATSRTGNSVQIPNQQVNQAGNIEIPYIPDPIHVAGRTTEAVATDITSKLKDRAIEPQVIVTVAEHRGNNVSVFGEVATPTRFSLDPGGMTLTGAISRAGGSKFPDYETVVTVKRNNSVQYSDLTSIIKNPSQDIIMAPGDMVYLKHEARVYMVLGATETPGAVGGTNNRRFFFDDEVMTLAEAISKAGGLDTARSDATYVFVFRFEDPKVLNSQAIDVSPVTDGKIPTVYRVNFASADGLFLAKKFDIRDQDMIFVSEAASADINKFLAMAVGASTTAYNTGIATYNFDHLQ